jgi:hypothetical protein
LHESIGITKNTRSDSTHNVTTVRRTRRFTHYQYTTFFKQGFSNKVFQTRFFKQGFPNKKATLKSIEMSNNANKSAGEDNSFALKDCALIAISTGKSAGNLKEFRDHIISIGTDSLYYHFWGGLLQPRFEEREYNNDFASWARHSLHDAILAEQLAVLDPSGVGDMEQLRLHLLEYIEERLDDSEYLQWARADHLFEFIRSQIVVFDTHVRASHPGELAELVPDMSPTSVFYHFVDARRRTPDRSDDFRAWLRYFGEEFNPLLEKLTGIDPYFITLVELRREVAEAFTGFFREGTR